MGREAPWQTLHPASLVVNLVPRTWGLVRGFWPFLLVIIAGGTADGTVLADLTLLLWFFLAAVANTVVHWATLRYRLADGRLELRSGLFNRQKRTFSPRRVQHVEVVRNVFHRVAGLAEVRIETASGDEVEGLLSALTEAEANRLVDALQVARGLQTEAETDETPVLHHSLDDLLRYGASSLRLGWVFLALAVGFETWQSMLIGGSDTAVDAVEGQLGALWNRPGGTVALVGVGLLVVAASWIGGIVTSVVRHHDLTVVKTADSLVVRQGLFTTRRIELPLARVQRVRVSASWLRRALGFGSVVIETASAQGAVQGSARSAGVVPVVYEDDLDGVLDVALAGRPRPSVASLRPPDPRALRRGRVRGVMQGSVVAALIVWRLELWGLPALGLPVLAYWLAGMDHRHQGWSVDDDFVVSRRGWLTRTTTWATTRRIQGVTVSQGPLLRRYGLSEIVVLLAGGSHVALPLLDEDKAWDLATTLAERVGQEAVRTRPRDEARDEAPAAGPPADDDATDPIGIITAPDPA